jgi:hypothetical protein
MFLIRISCLKGIFGNKDSVYVAVQYVQKRGTEISFQTNGLHSAPTNSAILVAVKPRVAGITLQPFASLRE